jgi:hypothetical protein
MQFVALYPFLRFEGGLNLLQDQLRRGCSQHLVGGYLSVHAQR